MSARAPACLPPLPLSPQYQTSSFSVRWEQLGYGPATPATVRDLWRGEDLGVFNASFSAQVRTASVSRQTPVGRE